jgi:hypothetical protein
VTVYIAKVEAPAFYGLGSDPWYSAILDELGNVGSGIVDKLETTLAQRYGAQVWGSMSPDARSAAIRAALADVQARIAFPWVIAGAALLILWWRR